VTFVVKKDGSITDAKVVKSVAPSLDAEALRVINAMPNWTPGKQGGQPVNVKYTVPLTFRLNGNDNKEVAQISNAGSDALSAGETFFVIDDKPATAEEVKQIDPKTIDHMDVLKGESATKLYGEKAKHGAVLIFTKKNQ
jgi:TonB family protein